jgi:hypothetical protein
MATQNLNNQATIGSNKNLSPDETIKTINPKIATALGFAVILVTLWTASHVYRLSIPGHHPLDQVPTYAFSLRAARRLRAAVLPRVSSAFSIRNQTQTKVVDAMQTETSLFERYPNSSNKGKMVVDESFIWVANGAGLVRYNKISGEQRIFTESDGLLGNETTGLIKYKDEVWITSQSRGISVLNTTDNTWRYFTTENGLISDGNLIIELDGDVIWLATIGGFAKYDFKTGKWTNWKEGAGIPFVSVRDFVFNNNSVWIVVSRNAYTVGGVLKLDKRTLTWTDLQNNNQVFSDRRVYSLYLDGDFLYALDDSVYRQNIISEQWESFPEIDTYLQKLNIGATKHNNQYWDFNNNGNIETSEELSSKRKIIDTHLLNQYCPEVKHSFNGIGIEEGYEKQFNFDGDILWFGCRQGFAFYNLTNKTWSFRETKSSYPAEIYKILAAKNGTLLVDSNFGIGLAIPDQQKWTLIRPYQVKDASWKSAFWRGDDIYFTEVLPSFGMGNPPVRQNLWKYNIHLKSISRISLPMNLSLSTSGKESELIGLNLNNNLWFDADNKIAEFNPASRQVISYEPKSVQAKYLAIHDIKQQDNVLWFVSNLGLGSFDLNSKEFEFVGNPVDIEHPDQGLDHLSLVGNQIWADASDNLGDGLYIYDLTTKTWEHVTQINSGLKFDSVYKLTGTRDYLLMASFGDVDSSQRKRGDKSVLTVVGSYIYEQYGLNVYDIANNTWKFFTAEDGMLDGEIGNELIDGNNAWFVNGQNGIWKLDFDKLK